MNKRLRGTVGLAINYSMLSVFGVIFALGLNYFLDDIISVPFLVGMALVINTITMGHMRGYWKDIIFGNRTKYSNHRPGFTDEVIEKPPTKTSKLDVSNDLNELLKAATKVKTTDHSSLKRNPLDD